MDKQSSDANETIMVIVSEEGMVRGEGRTVAKLKTEQLAVNINLFLQQMSDVLEKSPEKLGKFHFAEFEVNAEITAKGSLALLGTGGEAGATGGVKFVFRRLPVQE